VTRRARAGEPAREGGVSTGVGTGGHPFDAAPYAGPARSSPRVHDAPTLASGPDADEQAPFHDSRSAQLATWGIPLGSALCSVLLYAALWGAPFAAGLVAGMWVHELGHRAMARRLGLGILPIAFVPFVGAVQRLRAQPTTARDAALLALAGPLCGLWFALTCKLFAVASGRAGLALLGSAHALLALIDLLPFAVLDGGRIMAALTRPQRWASAGALTALGLALQSWLLLPSVAALCWRATRPAARLGHTWSSVVYVVLIGAGVRLL